MKKIYKTLSVTCKTRLSSKSLRPFDFTGETLPTSFSHCVTDIVLCVPCANFTDSRALHFSPIYFGRQQRLDTYELFIIDRSSGETSIFGTNYMKCIRSVANRDCSLKIIFYNLFNSSWVDACVQITQIIARTTRLFEICAHSRQLGDGHKKQ